MSLQGLAQISQIVGAVVFVLVTIWGWRKFMAPAVARYTEAKNAEIKDCERRREATKSDVEIARAEVARAEDEAREILARAQQFAERERTEELTAARAEAARIVRNAEGEHERARIAARDRLRIEFIEKALRRAREAATAQVDDATNARLVRATVEDLTRGSR